MDLMMLGMLGVAGLLVLLVLGVHIAVALFAVGAVGTVLITGLDVGTTIILGTMFNKVYSIGLIVLPLFILAGLVASYGKLSDDAYYSMSLWLNRIKGGLGLATLGGCTLFGTVCGSSLVTASVMAKASAPTMRKYGYNKRLAYGISAAGGNIGMLIPPSTLAVFYAILTDESPGKLLVGGIIPGILLFVLLSLAVLVQAYRKPELVGGDTVSELLGKVTWRQRLVSLKLVWPFVVTFVVLIGGIMSGIFSVTEAASYTILILMISVIIVRRTLRDFIPVLSEAASTTAMIFFIIVGAGLYSRFLVLTGVGPAAINWVVGMDLTPLMLTIAMCIVYIILGCFLDSSAMLSITIPLVYPVVKLMGIDPVWYGMAVIVAIHVGTITPPVGLNLFAVKAVADKDVSFEDIVRGVAPYTVATALVLVLVIAFPQLVTLLPSMMIK